MKRAAVVIGVNRTGGLPRLADAVGGAQRVEQWALEQGLPRELVRVHTDASAPVELAAIKRSIRELVELGSIEQLVVYFAGHGVNKGYGEYWLLSDAPSDTQAAVNVDGSVVLARQSGIPHVVFVSDACRTAPEGLQAQYVTGGELFPSGPGGDEEPPVDLFFAATLGNPALEVRDPADSAAAFKALYTAALVHALRGGEPSIVEAAAPATPDPLGPFGYVRPRPLKRWLRGEMTRRLAQLGLAATVSQVPDARITSESDAWLARVPLPPVRPVPPGPPGPAPGGASPRPASGGAPPAGGPAPAPAPAPTLHGVSGGVLRSFVQGGAPAGTGALNRAVTSGVPGSVEFAHRAVAASLPFGPGHFETQCGFKFRGLELRGYVVRGLSAQRTSSDVLSVVVEDPPAAVALLHLANGTSVMLPAIPGFLCGVTFEDGRLVDVAYEPSENGPRWSAFAPSAADLRALRGLVGSAARDGVLRLAREDAADLVRRVQYPAGLDPVLALHAGYAFHDVQAREPLRLLDGLVQKDLGVRWYDLALLAGSLRGESVAVPPGVSPSVPLLARGWGLLEAFGVPLVEAHREMRRHLVPTLWTQFDAEGTRYAEAMFLRGRI